MRFTYVQPPVKIIAALLFAATLATAGSRPERYVLVLQDPPLAAQVTTAKAGGQAQSDRRARILSAQSAVRSSATQLKVKVTSANQLLVNAVFVQATPEQVSQLRQIPGVARVERLRPMKRHLNRALDLMNVPAAWTTVGGEQIAGSGVKIGILDTGIDKDHPAFGELGLQYPDGFPKCSESRGECAYVSRKVIVARSYVNMLVGTDPATSRPDDTSPRDLDGHGTASAMIAAGNRTRGPLATISGIAPRAWLGSYKIFGSPGVNGLFTYDDVLIQALEDALQDGMDVVVTALGAPATWAPGDSGETCQNPANQPCDWRAAAVENAAKNGMTVVVSAGNSGDSALQYPGYNSVESPGTASTAITVGATTNSHILRQRVLIPNANSLPTLFGDGPLPDKPISARVRDVSSIGGTGRACGPIPNNTLNRSIALIERGDCSLISKIQRAEKAGAVAVIIYQGPNLQGVFKMRDLAETSIPALLVGNRDGQTLKDFALRMPDAEVTLDPAFTETQANADSIAFFSSRGPSIGESSIKPELVAVGTDVYTAAQKYDPNGDFYDPTGFTASEGTSFAASMAAGVAALVKQRHPGWSTAQIKSALVNTATTPIQDSDDNGRLVTAGVRDIGAGRLNADAALRSNVTVEPATVSFGIITAAPRTITLTLRNTSLAPVNLALQVQRALGSSAPVLNLNTAEVLPGGSTTIQLRIELRPSPGIYEGFVAIRGGAVDLRVPYLYFVGSDTPDSVLPLEGSQFEGTAGGPLNLTYKVVDANGIPVPNVITRTRATLGGGSVTREGGTTDSLGIGYAEVKLGPDAGDQQFYAAVGSVANFGIYFDGRARLTPVIADGGVVNLASGQKSQGLAPGSYISIYGSALSQTQRAFSTPYLPLSLGGVSVSFDVPERSLSAPGRVYFVSDGQLNVFVPWELAGSTSAKMKVSIGDTSSAVVDVPLNAYSPAIFEYPEAASNQSLASALDANFALIGSSNSARRGTSIQIYVNGLGPVDNQPASGEPSPAQPLATTRVVPEVTVGGVRAEVSFSGLTPGSVGLYQINVRVPDNSPTGLQPVVVTANGIASRPVNMPVQ